jgi:protein-tyrosine phosphatase
MSDQRTHAHVSLDGALNCRDIGGYAAAEGRQVRTGAIFRCDKLSELSDDDLDELTDRGIRTVIDFRADHEVARDPSRLWPSVTTHVPLPIGGDEAAEQIDFLRRILDKEITEFSVADVGQMYVDMLNERQVQFGRFMQLVTDFENLPVLFHCTAGKDRTGIGAALILELLGVERSTVLDDYELTNALRTAHRIPQLRPQLEAAGVDVDAILPALSAPRGAMEAALNHIDVEHGGAERYVADQLGFGDESLDLLRLQMLI